VKVGEIFLSFLVSEKKKEGENQPTEKRRFDEVEEEESLKP